MYIILRKHFSKKLRKSNTFYHKELILNYKCVHIMIYHIREWIFKAFRGMATGTFKETEV